MKNILPLFLMLTFPFFTVAQATITVGNTTLTERELAVDLQVPWEMLWGPDDYLWVTERRGRVLRINPETGNIITVLNIENQVESHVESGLLGMVHHPDFENTPKVYLVYNYPQGVAVRERLVSFEWQDSVLVNETFLINNITGSGIHNGSRLLIASDGKLLMTMGDTGPSATAQDMDQIKGKILRLNLDGSIPDDNPIPDSYIYSYGHRNPQGLTYGPNGQLYATEHGNAQSDEINLIESNRNYGWPGVEGACDTGDEINYCDSLNVREPLVEWTPCLAVNDISYYTHEAIPEWQGKMLMAVLGGFNAVQSQLRVLTFNVDGTEVTNEEVYFEDYGRLRDVCSNPHTGAIYFATNGSSYPSSGPNRIIEYRNLDYITSTNDLAIPDQFFNIYPNPSPQNEVISIEFSDSFLGEEIELFSYDGKLWKTQKIDKTLLKVSLHNLPQGNYFFKATSAKGMITRTLVIQ